MPKKTGTVTITQSNGGYELKIKPCPSIDKGRSSCIWLRGAIRDALSQTDRETLHRLEKCRVCIFDVYKKEDTAKTKDPDNLDIKTILNTTKGIFYSDDSLDFIGLHIVKDIGPERCTIVKILPPEKVLYDIK